MKNRIRRAFFAALLLDQIYVRIHTLPSDISPVAGPHIGMLRRVALNCNRWKEGRAAV